MQGHMKEWKLTGEQLRLFVTFETFIIKHGAQSLLKVIKE